jgi:hypothetical protein
MQIIEIMTLSYVPVRNAKPVRRRRDEAREAMAAGKDPAREKQRDKVRAKLDAENTFAPATAKRCDYLLSILCGSIGNMPIAEIEPADVLVAVRRIAPHHLTVTANSLHPLQKASFTVNPDDSPRLVR